MAELVWQRNYYAISVFITLSCRFKSYYFSSKPKWYKHVNFFTKNTNNFI
jgi:hypothetical protein